TVKHSTTPLRLPTPRRARASAVPQLEEPTPMRPFRIAHVLAAPIIIVFLLGAASGVALAQDTGIVTGIVLDMSRQILPGVTRTLTVRPGVHYENDIDSMGDCFGLQIPNIMGQRRTWNQITVDGLNGNELSGTKRMNSSINLDAIAEVKVLLNIYKAEF